MRLPNIWSCAIHHVRVSDELIYSFHFPLPSFGSWAEPAWTWEWCQNIMHHGWVSDSVSLIRCVTYPAAAWKIDEQASPEMMDLLLALTENVSWFEKYLSGIATVHSFNHLRYAHFECRWVVVAKELKGLLQCGVFIKSVRTTNVNHYWNSCVNDQAIFCHHGNGSARMLEISFLYVRWIGTVPATTPLWGAPSSSLSSYEKNRPQELTDERT